MRIGVTVPVREQCVVIDRYEIFDDLCAFGSDLFAAVLGLERNQRRHDGEAHHRCVEAHRPHMRVGIGADEICDWVERDVLQHNVLDELGQEVALLEFHVEERIELLDGFLRAVGVLEDKVPDHGLDASALERLHEIHPRRERLSEHSMDSFRTILAECNIDLDSLDSAECARLLADRLSQTDLTRDLVVEFSTGLQEYMDTVEKCNSLLEPKHLVHTLLRVPALQASTIAVVLQVAIQFMECDPNILKKVFAHLRNIQIIEQSALFTESIAQALEMAPTCFHLEFIPLLPEIIIDSQQSQVAKLLLDLMESNADLASCILDALAGITMDEAVLSRARDTAISQLQTADIDALPVLIRFILLNVSQADIPSVVQQLRELVDFESIASVLKMQEAALETAKGKSVATCGETLILDSFKFVFRTSTTLVNAWLKELQQVDSSSKFTVFDVLIICIVFSFPAYRRKVLTLVLSKLRKGTLLPETFISAIREHSSGIRQYSSSIILLSEALLSAENTHSRILAVNLYECLFIRADLFERQELIGSLITCIGSRQAGQVDAGLLALLNITENDPKGVGSFAIFIKSVVDFVDLLTMTQVKMIYRVMCILAVNKPGVMEESNGLSELNMLIQKQLSNADMKVIGVVGATLLISRLVGGEEADEVCTDNANSLLKHVFLSCKEFPYAMCVFYDEIALVQQHSPFIQEFSALLFDQIQDIFLESYIADSEQALKITSKLQDYALAYPKEFAEMECKLGLDVPFYYRRIPTLKP